jgi:hypothetical protein
MGRYLLFAAILFSTGSFGQVVQNLLTGDNFLPGLSEQQKRETISSVNQNVKAPSSSEELNPQLYKYANQDHLAPIRGTSADPNKAFQDYSKIQHMKTSGAPDASAAPTHPLMYDNRISIQERTRLQIESDMAYVQIQQQRSEEILREANKAFDPEVMYDLGLHNGEIAGRYVKAYEQLANMLSGSQKIDFARAVWLVENAHDPSLSWEEFNGLLQNGVQTISKLMVQDKLPVTDNLSKIMSIFKFMADTVKVFDKASEKTIVSKPMLYDYDDFAGKKDISKVFVSKLLRTGSGQCMSLPLLFYLYAKAFGADVNIAFAPQHTYVTFKDRLGNWQNIELTGRMFISTDFHWQSGFITTEQVKSGIYLRPSNEKETVAYLLTTFALTYVKTLGTDNRVLQMANTAKQYAPKNLTSHMIYAGYYIDLYSNVLRQYDMYNFSESKFNNDQQAEAIKQKALSAVQYIRKDLGWREMPDWAYKKWLEGVNQLANRDQHNVRRRQLEKQINGSK